MTSSPVTRLCMLDTPALPLDVFGHRPHHLRNAEQPECRGRCRDKDRDRTLADLVSTVTMTPAPGSAWVLFFVLHSPWCEETVFGKKAAESLSLEGFYEAVRATDEPVND